MAKSTMHFVSIVVPCRNEREHIREFLASVHAQDFGHHRWELIIADGMSDDGTRQILDASTAQYRNLRVVDNPARITPAGLNRAIRESRGDIIVRMDVHTHYAPDYVRCCVDALLKSGAQNVGGPARTKAEGYLHRAIAAAFNSGFASGGARFHDPNYEGFVDTVTYGCWWKQTLLEIGLFDEQLIRNQDDELNYRLIRHGGKIWQTPRIRLWYTPRPSLSRLWKQYFQYGFWKTVVMRKHGAPASLRHLVPALFLVALGVLLVTGLAGLVSQSPSIAIAGFQGFAALAAIYCAAALGASLLTARRFGWDLLPVLPAVFATYHFSYGTGFLSGMAAGRRVPNGESVEGAYTRLTR